MAYIAVLKTLFFLCIGIIVLSVLVNLIKRVFHKSPRLEGTLTVIVIVGALSAAGYWLMSREIASRRASQAESREADKHESVLREETQRAIGALVTSSGAVADWKASLCSTDNAETIFTTDLQRVLLRPDNRPVLISGRLTDVQQNGGDYEITLSSFAVCNGPRLRAEIAVNPSQVREVLSHRSDPFAYYAIAMRASSVEKQLVQSGASDAATGGSVTSGEFLVRGQCVQILFTGMEGISLDLGVGASH